MGEIPPVTVLYFSNRNLSHVHRCYVFKFHITKLINSVEVSSGISKCESESFLFCLSSLRVHPKLFCPYLFGPSLHVHFVIKFHMFSFSE